jgi:hypothetical protein
LFEQWYVTHAFDYGKNPLGSRDCGLQWEAWKAAVNAHTPKYHDVEQYLDGQA